MASYMLSLVHRGYPKSRNGVAQRLFFLEENETASASRRLSQGRKGDSLIAKVFPTMTVLLD
jgi:hypothetical protein